MNLKELDIDKICRTCKCVAPRMRSLYEGYENPHLRIDDMLMTCASVQVVCGDGLPSQICQACVEQLKNAFVFKRQCEDVDTSLREYAKNVKVNKIKEELESVSEPSNILNNFCIDQSCSKEKIERTQTLITPESADYIQLDDNQMLLTCRECAKIFTTAEGLQCHKCIHTGSMFKCKQCDKEYTELDHLKRHEHSHSRRRLFVCRICNKSCSRMEHLKRHLVTHLKEKPYFCKTCNRGFNRIEHLHSHLPRCKGDSVYPCDICSKVFKREDTLEVHKEMHDNELPKLPTIENLDHIEDHYYLMDQDANATFSDHSDVDDCFQHQVDLTESMDNDKMKEVAEYTHHDEESSVSEAVSIGANNSSEERGGDEVLVNEEVEESVEVKEEKLDSLESEYDILEDNNVGYSDIDCFKHEVEETETIDQEKVNEVAEFAHYENTLRGNGGYDNNERKDDDGEKEANENMESEEMEEKAEDKDENYEVTDEDSGDSTDSEYLPRNVSPEVKRNRGRPRKNHPKLSVPGRSRGRPSKKVKMEDDGDECDGIKKPAKRFPCTECSQRFCRRDYLVVHMRRHRGEKPFKCKYCGKGFPRATDLTVHERYHTGEKTHLCTVCGKGFGRSYNLRVHLRTHTGEKPYKCTYCKAAFAQGNDLKAHVRRHTGERFQCDLCTRSYLLGHLLTQHKRASHGINVMSNIRRLEPVLKQNNPDEPPTDSF